MSDTPQDPPPNPQAPTGAPTPPPAPAPPPPGAAPAGSTPPPPGYAPHPGPPVQAPYGGPQQQYGGAPSKDDNTMAMLIHVSAIFTGFVGPLIIWLIKKDESPFVDRHGKTALNFSFTLLIAYFVSAILVLILIGILMIFACMIVGIVFPIIAAIAANKGEEYTYPLSIKFFK